jgi:uncharacterized membrane protein YgcG
MSNISPDFIRSIGSLYESIHAQQSEDLNEESEYYDEEISILVEDIISKISLSMVYEGYTAEGVISFLADSSDQNILEKYLTFDENFIVESTISEEYVQEQLEIIDYCIDEGLGSRLFGGALKLAGRIASKPARMKVAQKMMTSKDPAKTAAAVDRLSRMKLNKAGAPSDITKKIVDAAPDLATKTRIATIAPTMGRVIRGVQKVKDIAKGAKALLTSPTAKKVALGAAGLGAAGLAGGVGGYIGAKMAGSGKDDKSSSTPSTSPSRPSTPTPGPRGSGGGSGSGSGGSGGGSGSGSGGGTGGGSGSVGGGSRPQKPSETPSGKGKSDTKDTPMQQWAKANPKLAARVKPGQSGYDEIQKTNIPELDKPRPGQKQDQTPTQGSSTAQIDTSSVDKAIEDEKKRQLERAQRAAASAASGTQKESYDIILEYLINQGHADSIEEANYIMMEMDSQTMRLIIDEYENNIIAEQISDWVDGLLEEGYDLSQYSWDDLVEYYMSN